MNIGRFKLDSSSILWIKLGGYAAVIVLGLALYYHFTVANASKKLRELSTSIIVVEAKYARYEKFDSFQNALADARGKTEALLPDYINILSGAQKSQNAYLDQISAMTVQSRVKLDKIAPDEVTGKRFWNISFTANYKSTCEFFCLLEKYFKVESVTIIGGGELALHKTEVKVSAVTDAVASMKMNPVTGKDIFDLYTEAMEAVSKVSTRETELDALQLTREFDPMYFAETIFIPVKQEAPKPAPKPRAAVETPQIRIDGIYWDPSTPVVVINGKAYKEKEEVNDIMIDKIGQESISVTWKGHKFEIKK